VQLVPATSVLQFRLGSSSFSGALVDGIPDSLILLALFCLGAVVGGQLNRGIYRLAWFSRSVSPWSPPPADAPARSWFDRFPVLGWFGLRREATIHGRGFWVRPLLIELATGVGFAWLYWYEVVHAGVYAAPGIIGPGPATLHAQYVAQLVLLSLMIVATFIDFDEQTIPDAITVPGSLAGLLFAALLPGSLPLVPQYGTSPQTLYPLHVASPLPWPGWLDGAGGLALGLMCLWGWCFAIIPWTWTTRRGWGKAWVYLAASVGRRKASRMALLIAIAGGLGVVAAWLLGDVWWRSLYTSLVGLAFGGGMIWAVRIVGSQALGQEAMGFGDVTLMAMIGTFVGWQATLVIFFLAPVAALFISVTQWLLTRRRDIAFGPYLCLATLFVLIRWGPLWRESVGQIFALGWYVPGMVAFCLALMWALLTIMRFLRERLLGDDLPVEEETAETKKLPAPGKGDAALSGAEASSAEPGNAEPGNAEPGGRGLGGTGDVPVEPPSDDDGVLESETRRQDPN